jgi:hypothetical protein
VLALTAIKKNNYFARLDLLKINAVSNNGDTKILGENK